MNDTNRIITPRRIPIRLRFADTEVYKGKGGIPRLAAEATHSAPTEKHKTLDDMK
jgi:hypothetical protein